MTAEDFRRLALTLPESVEGEHRGHPDFRVGGKVFATLGYPNAEVGMVKLTPDEQALMVEAEPQTFAPVPGGWGRGGATHVRLAAADEAGLAGALARAWRNVAPKRLAEATAVPPAG